MSARGSQEPASPRSDPDPELALPILLSGGSEANGDDWAIEDATGPLVRRRPAAAVARPKPSAAAAKLGHRVQSFASGGEGTKSVVSIAGIDVPRCGGAVVVVVVVTTGEGQQDHFWGTENASWVPPPLRNPFLLLLLLGGSAL